MNYLRKFTEILNEDASSTIILGSFSINSAILRPILGLSGRFGVYKVILYVYFVCVPNAQSVLHTRKMQNPTIMSFMCDKCDQNALHTRKMRFMYAKCDQNALHARFKRPKCSSFALQTRKICPNMLDSRNVIIICVSDPKNITKMRFMHAMFA